MRINRATVRRLLSKTPAARCISTPPPPELGC